ncbi:hypothetical protein [Massilia pseudoviolaceinigra]|uniref:hypothetical protein n=1 Tax=Massilia pseudoviolaceinigra TaxID=3057165 RepID=UPI00279646ED|nr:hypothetical protein [Massilia sp. CCM 9206]MDQ1921315.1 hypothetical protein [Massilia sp. CCM 9206]
MPFFTSILLPANVTIIHFIFAVLVSLNLYTIWRVRRSNLSRFQQNMVIAVIWITPFIGLFVAWLEMRVRRERGVASEEALPNLLTAAAPEVLARSGLPVFDVRAHLAAVDGVPLLDWPALVRWASQAPQPADVRGANAAGKRAWLLHLRDACGDHFQLHEFEHAYLLSSMENRVVRATAGYISTTRTRIRSVLDGIARFDEDEKSVLFVTDSLESYYQYILCYYPDGGHFAASGGVFVNAGCAHFVVPSGDLAAIEPIIAHELTHSALAHLALPTWLDEGLAVNTERRLCPLPAAPDEGRELKERLLAFWGTAEIQQFWSGQSFLRPDEGNLLSYELARIIVEHLARDWTSFSAFVNNARRAAPRRCWKRSGTSTSWRRVGCAGQCAARPGTLCGLGAGTGAVMRGSG